MGVAEILWPSAGSYNIDDEVFFHFDRFDWIRL